jgi:hypothetical protein
MALTHKLKDDSNVIYPFGPQCKGYSNEAIEGVSEAITQDVIDLLVERDTESANEILQEVSSKGKKD